MTEYYRLIAILESQLSQTSGASGTGDLENAGSSSRGADELYIIERCQGTSIADAK